MALQRPRPAGDPASPQRHRARHTGAGRAPVAPIPRSATAACRPRQGPVRRSRRGQGTIAAPDPALLEPALDFPGAKLPRIAADGRTAMRVYAAPIRRQSTTGRGVAAAGGKPRPERRRQPRGDRQPAGPPCRSACRPIRRHDAGPACSTTCGAAWARIPRHPADGEPGLSAQQLRPAGADDRRRARPRMPGNLEWVLSRFAGYVGVTGASDGHARGAPSPPPPPRSARCCATWRGAACCMSTPPEFGRAPRPGGPLRDRHRGRRVRPRRDSTAAGSRPWNAGARDRLRHRPGQRRCARSPSSASPPGRRPWTPAASPSSPSAPWCRAVDRFRTCPTGPTWARSLFDRPATCSSPAGPTSPMPRARPAAGSCPQGGIDADVDPRQRRAA